jgi:hypothetical protein
MIPEAVFSRTQENNVRIGLVLSGNGKNWSPDMNIVFLLAFSGQNAP